ncbi:MAG: ABC transporter permease [Clostridiales bacterium]|nr:ABC transporter permease [Clostridiales bacterium]MCI7703294.1 ABC transporter permease [Clostridiales bacterium]MDY3764430.1 ABC transporter permease [Candidatus Ventricola sp.]MDY4541504.1 ABC transporter permease [Candidatus Ventricola sp.]
MKAVKRYLKDNLGILIALAAMILFLCVWPATAKTFPTKTNLFNLLRQSSTNLMLACGMTMVIILGGIDLSVGSIIAMSGCFAAGAVVWGGMPEIVGLTLGVLSGLMFGLFNGAVIAWTNIPPFIVTLASMNLAKGIAYVFSGGKPIRCMTDAWKFLGAGYVLGIPTPVWTMFIVFFLCVLFLNRTRIGRHIYAVGGNSTAAKFSGISTAKVKFTVFAISGTLAGLAGVTIASRLYSGTCTSGNAAEMDAIAAVVIGGTSMSGGSGKLGGTLIGALIIGILNNGLNLMGVNSDWQYIIKGIVILGAVYVDYLRTQKKAK